MLAIRVRYQRDNVSGIIRPLIDQGKKDFLNMKDPEVFRDILLLITRVYQPKSQ